MFINTIALPERMDSSAIENIIITKDEPLLTTNRIKKAVQLKYEIELAPKEALKFLIVTRCLC